MEFHKVETEQQARDLIRIMPEVIAIDTEYVKGNPRTTQLLSVIVADSERAWAISPSLLPILTPTMRARKLVFLQEYNHNDTVILLKHGCDIRQVPCFNCIDMHHLINENLDHDLDTRVQEKYGDTYKKDFWNKYQNFDDAPEDEALEYACKDAIYTYRFGVEDLEALDSAKRELYNHGRKLSLALLDTELEGICVNIDLIKSTKIDIEKQINEYLPKLRTEFDDYCNMWEMEKWASLIDKLSTDKGRCKKKRPKFTFTDPQLVKMLYDERYMGLPVLGLTKKAKQPSVDYDTLEKLVKIHPEIKTIFEYKEIKTVYSTFVKGMLERVENGRIYPHFNVSGTTTGRISHSDPNMGNLPKDGPIRNFFIPNPGYVIIGADYEQLEVVVELNLTEDPGLKEIILGGASKHDLFKAELDKAGFNLPRSQVKNVNFALQYDAQAKKIAKMVGCSESDAQRIIDVFYTKFSGVKRLKEETKAILARDGKVTNLAGRTRHFRKPKNGYEKAKQERQAYNFLIQGVAGEACNRAYTRFHQYLKEQKAGRGLFSVHDEIVAEVKNNHDVEFFKRDLTEIMEQSTHDFGFRYPLKAKAYGGFSCWKKT